MVPASLLFTGNEQLWWKEVVIRQKLAWMATDTKFNGDMPVTVLPERDGKLLAFIIAPTPDKEYGYLAAQVCRQHLAADTLTFITDGHLPLGKQADVVAKQMEEGTWKAGAMQQACDNEKACERGLYTDCMNVNRVSADRHFFLTMTYKYLGKGSGQLEWTPENDYPPIGFFEGEDRLGGAIPDTLNSIIKLEPLHKQDEASQVLRRMGLDPARLSHDAKLRFFSKTGLMFLKVKKFTVYDFLDNPIKV